MLDNMAKEHVASVLKKTLNSHGYGFQYAVLNLAAELAMKEEAKSKWYPDVAEFPVWVSDVDARVDFILRHKDYPAYLVAECKRVNPGLSWAFAKATLKPSLYEQERAFVHRISYDIDGNNHTKTANVIPLSHVEDIYHVPIEIKSGQRGDEKGQGRGAIEDASVQVCRGVSGLVKRIGWPAPKQSTKVVFFPVIFTTAKLWVTSVDLTSADHENGEVDITEADIEERPWVLFHYHHSLSIAHQETDPTIESTFQDRLYKQLVQTIAVVNAQGIAAFLEASSSWFYNALRWT